MEKQYLKIQSLGEIETEAFTLLGASSKRGDETKIGYFGSGLKYSIAALLRNNIDFKVFSGEKEIRFSVMEKRFRDNDYLSICVNGVETSMTTTMGGADWDIAFAPIREIYSNALDECDNVILEYASNLKGELGTTTFLIEKTQGVEHFYKNFMSYFCDKNPNVLSSNKYASIYPCPKDDGIRLFRKGILCYHNEKLKSLFHYNSSEFTINESRVLNAEYSAKISIAKAWKEVNDNSLILELLTGLNGGNSGYYEHGLDFSTWVSFSQSWFDVCKNLKFIPAEILVFAEEKDTIGRYILPKNLLMALNRQFDGLDILGLTKNDEAEPYIEVQNPSSILVNKVIDAVSKLNDTRYKHRFSNPIIKYVRFEKDTVLGMADDGKILLSTKLDTKSVDEIAKVIIEENEHNITGFNDETRIFQNHLFDLHYDELIK
mgnify:CR=1 FL=1